MAHVTSSRPDVYTPSGPSLEVTWGLIFLIPYIVVFALFVIYPIGYGVYLGADPAGYRHVFNDPIYYRTAVNTVVFLLLAVNLKMVLALALSGFFAMPHWWVRVLGVLFLLPWVIPHVPSIMSIRWMLNSEWGMINNILWDMFGVIGPAWLVDVKLAFGGVIAVHIWKYLPFWTMIFVTGRMAIAPAYYEAAAIDGAGGFAMFRYITWPMLRNLFITSMLLSIIWSLGDFNSVYLLTGGGPIDRTNTFATLGIRYSFQQGNFEAGVATVITALPFLVPLVVILIKRLNARVDH